MGDIVDWDDIWEGDMPDEYEEDGVFSEGKTIFVSLEFGDHKDWNSRRVSLQRKRAGFEVSYGEWNLWCCREMAKYTRRYVDATPENEDKAAKLYSLIMDAVNHKKIEPDDAYSVMGRAGIEETRTDDNGQVFEHSIVSDVITFEMLDILSEWAELPEGIGEKVCCIEDDTGRNWEALEFDTWMPRKSRVYSFSYVNGCDTFNYYVEPEKYKTSYTVATEIVRGNEVLYKLEFVEKEQYPDFLKDLTEWSLACKRADGPIAITYDGETLRTDKVPQKLADIMDYFSPSGFALPAEIIEEGNDSVYVAVRDVVPDAAYADNQTLRYLCIVAHSQSIGKYAFARSALSHVEMRQGFWEYKDKGDMPAIGEGAFDDCFGLSDEMLFYDGKKYLGAQPDDEYSICLGPVRDESEKLLYPTRRERNGDGLVFVPKDDGYEVVEYVIKSGQGDLVIPSTYDGKPVVEIKNGNFGYYILKNHYYGIKRIILPKTLRSIDPKLIESLERGKVEIVYDGTDE